MLSDTFAQASRVKFRVNRDILYDYQLRHPNRDPIIKALLRLYQGILSDHCVIKEEYLADLLRKPLNNITQVLRELKKDEIIDYVEPSNQPRITLLRERVQADNFNIDQKLFRFRKERKMDGIDQILAYIGTNRCRQRFILHYFNDQVETDCGVCDSCKAAGRKKMNRADYLSLRKGIFEKLETSEFPVKKLIEQFEPAQRNWVITVLQYLLNEEAIFKYNGILRLKSEKS